MLKSLVIDFLTNYFLQVTWEFLEEPSAAETWILQRSESPETDFEDVSPPLKQTQWLDDVTNKFSLHRTLYYRIKRGDKFSAIKSVTPNENTYIRNHIIWRNNLLLRRFSGTPVAIFLAHSFGARCPECYDEITKRVTHSKCEICYGSSFENGYAEPIAGYAQFDPKIKTASETAFGKLEPRQSGVWISNYPVVKPGDLIYDYAGKGHFWKIDRLSLTEHRRSPVRQICVATQLRRDTIEYRIPVPAVNDCTIVNIFKDTFV